MATLCWAPASTKSPRYGIRRLHPNLTCNAFDPTMVTRRPFATLSSTNNPTPSSPLFTIAASYSGIMRMPYYWQLLDESHSVLRAFLSFAWLQRIFGGLWQKESRADRRQGRVQFRTATRSTYGRCQFYMFHWWRSPICFQFGWYGIETMRVWSTHGGFFVIIIKKYVLYFFYMIFRIFYPYHLRKYFLSFFVILQTGEK